MSDTKSDRDHGTRDSHRGTHASARASTPAPRDAAADQLKLLLLLTADWLNGDRTHADCVMAGERAGKGEIRMAGSLFFLRFFQALDFALNNQFFIAAQRHAVLLGKTLSAFSHKINMRAFIQDQA